MSPSCGAGVFEASVATVQRDPAIKTLVELDFSPSEAEAAVLGWDLEAAAFPLHDVVVADDAFHVGTSRYARVDRKRGARL